MAPGAVVRQSAAQSLTNDLDRRRAARRAVVPERVAGREAGAGSSARQAEAERQARGLNNREWWAGQESARKARQAAAERAQ